MPEEDDDPSHIVRKKESPCTVLTTGKIVNSFSYHFEDKMIHGEENVNNRCSDYCHLVLSYSQQLLSVREVENNM